MIDEGSLGETAKINQEAIFLRVLVIQHVAALLRICAKSCRVGYNRGCKVSTAGMVVLVEISIGAV
ncbi:hypothetical protein KKC1_30200 [Calderihabitans maritimus]|uniref:Uncharacterized protein n=1 Tax=Calderihabitans maritimus TaxID=1246530 RepID=A0A1Z5HX09_9FIRM|nr:hypothetical protein KKC1_30200 [Calderihabitans maritimus]